MENLKSIFYTLFFIVLLSFGGYWAFDTIESGGEHMDTQKFRKLEEENKELKKELEVLKKELIVLNPEIKEETQEVAEPEEPKETEVNTVITYKNQTLINEIQKLINDDIVMKLKSKGSRVGTIQKFFNLYNKTNNRIDNDYGANLQKAVLAFQKAQGLPETGEVGVKTYSKMIEWLKKQG